MFEFVKDKAEKQDSILAEIKRLEKKYSIHFPQALKDFYHQYDNKGIKLCSLDIDGYQCEVAKIVPILAPASNFESIKDEELADGFIPKEYYPIARDRGGDYYYWDSKSGNVFLVLVDDFENPFKVASSVEEFFEMLSSSPMK